jgi:WD40 repeat protein
MITKRQFGLLPLIFLYLAIWACSFEGENSKPSQYWDVAWSPDGESIAAAGTAHLTLFTDTLEETGRLNTFAFVDVAWQPYGDLVAAQDGGNIVVFNGTTLAEQNRISVLNNRALAWSPDGELLAVSSEKNVEIWQFSMDDYSLQQITILTGHQIGVKSVSWSPDSRMLASADQDGTLMVFDAQTGQTENIFNFPSNQPVGSIVSIDWSPNNNFVAMTHSMSSEIVIWDAVAGTEVARLDRGTNDFIAVKWSPDGSYLMSAGWHRVFIWSSDSGLIQKSFGPENGDIVTATWNPDGQRLAIAGSIDNRPTIWIWDITSDEVITASSN